MKAFLLLVISLPVIITRVHCQNVGIGTGTPNATGLLHVNTGASTSKGLLVTGVYGSGSVPDLGAGSRMMFYPAKSAFRAGNVDGTEWNNLNVGNYSFAAGYYTQAIGLASIALGWTTTAIANYGMAIGYNASSTAEGAFSLGYGTIASGEVSVALGIYTTASGQYSTAMGVKTDASGRFSTAMGDNTSAAGIGATSMGGYTYGAGNYSTAMGFTTTASGAYSTAMGNYVSTSGFEGALTIGDNSTTTVMQTFVANGMRARFASGYRFFTNSAANIGAFLNANANSWAALGDVRLKENFLPVDGELFLTKIAVMPQFTWNYIGQDEKTLRHYGPMAQDFFKAFGKDGFGEIGCDTLINQQDFLGVNLVAIQALEKRTTILQQENQELVIKNRSLEASLAELTNRLEKVERLMADK